MKTYEIVMLSIVLAMITGWIMNFYKLTQLDFEAPYKAEVIRVIGIVPPIGGIVGYISIGEEDEK